MSQTQTQLKGMSIWGAFANLGNTVLGAGLLGLPYAFANVGYVMGIFMLIICAYFSMTALHFLSMCCKQTMKNSTNKESSFYTVAKIVDPRLPLLVDLAVIIKCFGVSASYLIVVGDLMPTACDQMGCIDSTREREIWVFIGFCFAAPFCFSHSLDYLKYTSSLCLLFLLFTTFIIFLFAVNDENDDENGGELDPCKGLSESECKGDESAGMSSGRAFARVFSIFIFSYTCQQNIFAVVNELVKPNMRRIDSIVCSVIGSAFTIYLIMGICGYSTYGSNVESDVLINYPKNGLMSCIRVMISFVVAFSYPLQVNPGRRCILTMIDSLVLLYNGELTSGGSGSGSGGSGGSGGVSYDGLRSGSNDDGSTSGGGGSGSGSDKDIDTVAININTSSSSSSSQPTSSPQLSPAIIILEDPTGGLLFGTPVLRIGNYELKYLIVTVVFIVLTLIVALSVQDLGVVLELIGATGSTLIGYILPGLLYLRIFEEGSTIGVVGSGDGGRPTMRNSGSSTTSTSNNGGGGNDDDDMIGLWPTDKDLLMRMAQVQFIAGCIIVPVSLAFIAVG